MLKTLSAFIHTDRGRFRPNESLLWVSGSAQFPPAGGKRSSPILVITGLFIILGLLFSSTKQPRTVQSLRELIDALEGLLGGLHQFGHQFNRGLT